MHIDIVNQHISDNMSHTLAECFLTHYKQLRILQGYSWNEIRKRWLREIFLGNIPT